MALIESNKGLLDTSMPAFRLRDPEGQEWSSESVSGEMGTLVVFTCNHCPYAIALWPRLIRLAESIGSRGIETVAINPNINPDYPDDSPDNMARQIQERQISFPYLIDEDQSVADAFKATCTPDLFLYDKDQKLKYHGRFDDSWQDESKVTTTDLKNATEQLITGEPIFKNQVPSMGCSIKWVTSR